jgi:hypothetical protein
LGIVASELEMMEFQAWGVITTADMLTAMKALVERPDTCYLGSGYACDAQGRLVQGHDDRAIKWSPMGAWQKVAFHMPKSIHYGYVTERTRSLLDEHARKIAGCDNMNISTFNNIAPHSALIVVFDRAIAQARQETK